MKIGFIGLGKMGSAMAANLVKAGHDVTVFNRSPEKTRSLLKLGAQAFRLYLKLRASVHVAQHASHSGGRTFCGIDVTLNFAQRDGWCRDFAIRMEY